MAEKAAILQKLEASIKVTEKRQLKLMMTTFVWAIRNEMIRGNMDQVASYFHEFIKSKDVMEVALANSAGVILIATNQKDEGQHISKFIEGANEIREISIFNRPGSDIILAPVMSLESQIGTLIVVYEAAKFRHLIDGI